MTDIDESELQTVVVDQERRAEIVETVAREVVVVDAETVMVVEAVAQGPRGVPGADGTNGIDGQDGQDGQDGARGEPGPPGGLYEHDQATPAATWIVPHGLGVIPSSVSVLGTDGSTLISPVHHDSADQLTVSHSVAIAGKVLVSP